MSTILSPVSALGVLCGDDDHGLGGLQEFFTLDRSVRFWGGPGGQRWLRYQTNEHGMKEMIRVGDRLVSTLTKIHTNLADQGGEPLLQLAFCVRFILADARRALEDARFALAEGHYMNDEEVGDV